MTDKFRIIPDDGPLGVSEATVGENGHFEINAPMFDGLRVQVQHPLEKGEATEELGVIGMGISTINGTPHVLLNMRHPDGTTLAAVMDIVEFAGLGSIYTDTIKRLGLLGAINVVGNV